MANPIAISSLEEVLRILEGDDGLLSSACWFHRPEKGMSRKGKAIGAWRHSQSQTGVETKATESHSFNRNLQL